MLPEFYIAPAISREIQMEHERRLARRQLLHELPATPSRRRRLASRAGTYLVALGEKLRQYGQLDYRSETLVEQPHIR